MPGPQDPLERFSEIEKLVSRVYFRFSHLFLNDPELRDFWWQMAKEEEEHSSILLACKALVDSHESAKVDPGIAQGKAERIEEQLNAYLGRGTASITVDEAFRIALDIEGSELDAIYSRLVKSSELEIGKTMEHVGVPASVQRRKLAAAVRRFATDPEVRASAEAL
ncbi:MAG TPA: hypothetical protein VGB25_01460 [Candidatus Binatia bacterium]